jgi:hypothetical protein
MFDAERRVVIAFQEAGHAVAAYKLGATLLHVSIAQPEPVTIYDTDELEVMAQATIAGPIAQRPYIPMENPYRETGCARDEEQFMGLVCSKVANERLARAPFGVSDPPLPVDYDAEIEAIEALRADLTARATALIVLHEPHVHALAARLLEQETLTGAEVAALLAAVAG